MQTILQDSDRQPPVLRFASLIEMRGCNPYVHISAVRASRLRKNWRRPIPVLVRVNGQPKKAWRINLMPAGDGSYFLYLHQAIRTASNTKVGNKILIEISFDPTYRNGPLHSMTHQVRKALFDNTKAKSAWQALSPSRKKEILRYFASLKSSEAEARNVNKLINALSGIDTQFLGRHWVNGS